MHRWPGQDLHFGPPLSGPEPTQQQFLGRRRGGVARGAGLGGCPGLCCLCQAGMAGPSWRYLVPAPITNMIIFIIIVICYIIMSCHELKQVP